MYIHIMLYFRNVISYFLLHLYFEFKYFKRILNTQVPTVLDVYVFININTFM